MRASLSWLSPTRSPALAIIVLVTGPVLTTYIGVASFRHSHLSFPQSQLVSTLGIYGAVLLAAVLYGMAPGFRASTKRWSVSLPRPVLITFWLWYWLWFIPAAARQLGWWEWLDLPLLDWTVRVALGAFLLTLVLLLLGVTPRPDPEERGVRASAPPVYRTMAWVAVSLAMVARGVDEAYFRGVHVWEAVYLLTMAAFFLAYALDAHWCRRQRLAAQDEPATPAETEEAPAPQ
jgi:hypothetical protein